MKEIWKDALRPLLITLALVFIVETFSSALLPFIGLTHYRIPFNVLVILFMGFKLNTPYIGLFIFVIQYFHGFFSVEGWEMGTIAGILITTLIGYLKEIMHFSSAIITILITQLFQVLWFIIISSLIYLKTESFAYIVEKFWRFLPESALVSLIAPFFFFIFDQIWVTRDSGILREQV
ncbi:MAG: hypothetical protein OXB84_03260 [Halobacteriovoraceae bacterium]|nr:hypothetical protein [Halobacteriovoraceae bacterium]